MNRNRLILGACLEECIHVAGIMSFLQLARENGYETVFLGGAIPVDDIISNIKRLNPETVAISYRLSPETAEAHLRELIQAIEKQKLRDGRRYIFGGTDPVANVAKRLGFFDEVFGGSATTEDVLAFLQQREIKIADKTYTSTLPGRIAQKYPMPVIRHHFGLPSFEATLEGVRKLAEAKVLDIISLAIDQDAQENFFHPERQNLSRKGAGGVPVRTPEQFRMLYEASRCGNYPLMRCYAGTDDLLELAQVYLDTFNNCFAAIPIFWFNKLDRRGPMGLQESIETHIDAIQWHAKRNIPVELNEPHHWSLRGAHDTIYVAASYLSAYIAKKLGVKDYIMQMMFNTPSEVTFKMDLAKMLAVIELTDKLQDSNFNIHRETRAGLMSFPRDMNMAKGQLAYSTFMQMAVKPEILHVVAYCEGDHATTPEEAIESCLISQKVIENSLCDMPDMTLDFDVQYRKDCLKDEAIMLIDAIGQLGSDCLDDPLLDPETLANAVKLGFLDAPQIMPSEDALGKAKTKIIYGACYAVDEDGELLTESERLENIWSKNIDPSFYRNNRVIS